MTKVCSKCHEEKALDDFHKKTRQDGTTKKWAACKKCVNTYNHKNLQKLKADPPAYDAYKQQLRATKIEKAFGVTWEQRETMLINQGRRCAICQQLEIDLPKRLAVDHDHKTGKIRGLLCSHCNLGLGAFKDVPVRLLDAAIYLEEHSKANG